jgi:hypothetical protein
MITHEEAINTLLNTGKHMFTIDDPEDVDYDEYHASMDIAYIMIAGLYDPDQGIGARIDENGHIYTCGSCLPIPGESGRTYLTEEDIINLSKDYDNATGVFADDGDRDDDWQMMVGNRVV